MSLSDVQIRVDGVTTHKHAGDVPDFWPYLCIVAGEPYRRGAHLHMSTREPGKVTCTRCLEWMHA